MSLSSSSGPKLSFLQFLYPVHIYPSSLRLHRSPRDLHNLNRNLVAVLPKCSPVGFFDCHDRPALRITEDDPPLGRGGRCSAGSGVGEGISCRDCPSGPPRSRGACYPIRGAPKKYNTPLWSRATVRGVLAALLTPNISH